VTDLQELLEQESEALAWAARAGPPLVVADAATELEQLRRLAEPFSTEDWAALLGEPPRPPHPTPDW
jgi:hypothetical protein